MKHDKLAKAAFAVGAVLAAGAAATGTASAASPTDALTGVTGALPAGDLAGQAADGQITENPLDNKLVGGAVHSVEQTGGQLAGQVKEARAGGQGQGNSPMVGTLPAAGLLGGLPVGGLLGGLPLG